MDQDIHFFDANHQVMKGTGLTPTDNAGAHGFLVGKNARLGDSQALASEAGIFAFFTGILMNVALVGAIGTLIKAITRVLG
jgi:hypothetical protein